MTIVRRAVTGLQELQQQIRKRSKAKLSDVDTRSAIDEGRLAADVQGDGVICDAALGAGLDDAGVGENKDRLVRRQLPHGRPIINWGLRSRGSNREQQKQGDDWRTSRADPPPGGDHRME